MSPSLSYFFLVDRTCYIPHGVIVTRSATTILDDSMQWPARRPECVNSPTYCRACLQRWGMVRLETRVNHDGPLAAPMFLLRRGADAIHVRGRVRARERHPEKITQRTRDEIAVVHEHDEGKVV